MATPWTERRHPEYGERVRREEYAWDHFTGEAYDKQRQNAHELKDRYRQIATPQHPLFGETDAQGRPLTRLVPGQGVYLVRRSQGESIEAYRERVSISRFPTHMSKVVGAFTGQLEIADGNTTRIWSDEETEGLGQPTERGTIAHRLYHNIDGRGSNYPMLIRRAANRLTAVHRLWYVVEPPTTPDGDATVRLLPQHRVVNWIEQNGTLIDVLVRDHVDTRTDLTEEDEPDEPEKRYWRYTLEGLERYRVDEDDNVVAEGEDPHEFYRSERRDDDQRRLPIGYVELPIQPHVGYMVATGCNYLWNFLSDIRAGIRNRAFSDLRGKVSDTEWENTVAARLRGANILQGDWDHISPDPGFMQAAYEIYQQEIRDFYVTSFQHYEDAASERTATEIRQDQDTGRFSFLALLAAALDEFENNILHLVTQIYFPTQPAVWGSAYVDRGTDFQPIDVDQQLRQIRERYLGGGSVPLTLEAAREVVREHYQADGLPAEEEDIDAMARDLLDAQTQQGQVSLLNLVRGRNGGEAA